VFERDRTFTRLATFEDATTSNFAPSSGTTLRSLFFEWHRTQRDLETVS
jgi:hypothetical protein